jgi:hypothetical protein
MREWTILKQRIVDEMADVPTDDMSYMAFQWVIDTMSCMEQGRC